MSVNQREGEGVSVVVWLLLAIDLSGDDSAGARSVLALGFAAAIHFAIDSHPFRMLLLPGVRQQPRVVGFARQRTIQDVLQVQPDVQMMLLRAAHHAHQARHALP